MAEKDKRFYWLKLHRDFFKTPEIKVVRKMPSGDAYIMFYLMLLAESIDKDGVLRFTDKIPYNIEMLAAITDTNVDTAKSAIELFVQLKLMEIWEDGTVFMVELKKLIGSETYWAERKRLSRSKQAPKQLENRLTLSNQSQTSPGKSKELELDLELDPEEDLKKNKEPYGEHLNVFLTTKEQKKILTKWGEYWAKKGIDKLSQTKAANEKLKYSSDYAALNKWVWEAIKAVPVQQKRFCKSCQSEIPGSMQTCPVCGESQIA